MPDANGSYVKVYLYLSMCIQSGEKRLSVTSLADMMENTEKDIIRALHYWEKKGLMVLQRDSSTSQITKVELCSPDTQANPESSSYQDARERLAEKENPPKKEKPSAEQ